MTSSRCWQQTQPSNSEGKNMKELHVSQKHSISLSLPALHAVWRSSFRVFLFPNPRRKLWIWKTLSGVRRRLVACIVYSAKSFIWQLGLSSAFYTPGPSLRGLFEVRCLRLSSGVHLRPLLDSIGSLAQIGDRQTGWQCRVWVGAMKCLANYIKLWDIMIRVWQLKKTTQTHRKLSCPVFVFCQPFFNHHS